MCKIMDLSAHILNSARTPLKDSLDQNIKDRILQYLVDPTSNLWSDISGIIINEKGTTIWQAIVKADPSFPRVGQRYDLMGNMIKDWNRIPNRELVLRAIMEETRRI